MNHPRVFAWLFLPLLSLISARVAAADDPRPMTLPEVARRYPEKRTGD